MITDGVISDMERSIQEIVDASDLPFSISYYHQPSLA
jgi:hypothetical protein